MKPRTRTAIVAASAVLLSLTLAASVGLWAQALSLTASLGKAHAAQAARSLASMDATGALEQFGAASEAFASATRSLGPDWAADMVTSVPWLGRQYAAARALLGIGRDVSEAGARLAATLKRASALASSSRSTTRFGQLLASGHGDIAASLGVLLGAVDRAGTLSPEGLVPPLAESVRSVQAMLRQAAPLTSRLRAGMPLLRYLLKAQRRILVVSQDGAELRPTGGFAGSFGIIEMGPEGLRVDEYRDVYALPNPRGRVPMPPGALMAKDFGFRDANWWIDFPTSARAMLAFWSDYRQPPVDAVIVIDTVAIADVLRVTGPVAVSSIRETFTSANVLDRLLYLIEVKPGSGKEVLVAFAKELEKRVLGADPTSLMRSARAMANSADQKHIQGYFVDPAAQSAIVALGWSGRVGFDGAATDVLAVSNAMNLPGKANAGMRKSVRYTVRLRPDGSADTTLVLSYAATAPYPKALPPKFRDWLRVYRSPGTVFVPSGHRSAVVTTTEFGFPAEVRTFSLSRGQRHAETVVARVPNAVAFDAGAAAARSARYRLSIVRQADLVDVPTTIEITAPAGWQVSTAIAQFSGSGQSAPVTVRRDGASVANPLRGDLVVEVRVARS